MLIDDSKVPNGSKKQKAIFLAAQYGCAIRDETEKLYLSNK